MPHSLNCSNPLVVSGLGAIGNYNVGVDLASIKLLNANSCNSHTIISGHPLG